MKDGRREREVDVFGTRSALHKICWQRRLKSTSADADTAKITKEGGGKIEEYQTFPADFSELISTISPKNIPLLSAKLKAVGAAQIGASDIGQWHGRTQTKLKS